MDFVPGAAFGLGTARPAPDLTPDHSAPHSSIASPNSSIYPTPKITFNVAGAMTGDFSGPKKSPKVLAPTS